MNFKKSIFTIGLLLAVFVPSQKVCAEQEHYYFYVPLRDLVITGSWPDRGGDASELQWDWQTRMKLKYFMPYAATEAGQEIYIDYNQAFFPNLPNSQQFNLWRVQTIKKLLDNASVAN